ncbi:MAG: hypothetical protein ACREBI_02760 [Nitrosotalea sp.]
MPSKKIQQESVFPKESVEEEFDEWGLEEDEWGLEEYQSQVSHNLKTK